MMNLTDLSPDELLAEFLDACRDRRPDAARDAIAELRYRVWAGSRLPRDVRQIRRREEALDEALAAEHAAIRRRKA